MLSNNIRRACNLRIAVGILIMLLFVSAASAACIGDINGDNKVNSNDFVLFANAYNSASGDSRYNVKADINNNGVINSADFVMFASVYGTACSGQLDPKILSESNFIDSLGYFTVVGEVQNNLTENINYVKITATFYDVQNNVIGMDYTYTDLEILRPGQKSPFELSSYPDKISPSSYKLILTYSKTNLEPYNGLQILSHTSKIDQLGYYEIVGEVKNSGDRTATFVKVVATYYDSSGKVIGKSYTFTSPDEIPKGNTAPFETSSYPLKINPAKYELHVEGQ